MSVSRHPLCPTFDIRTGNWAISQANRNELRVSLFPTKKWDMEGALYSVWSLSYSLS